ncbi:MAG: M1 family metallopeptidase [Saprospiraceae bacterium]|nr:M1 family metallopeptidase [Saprospiraceae bacterium]
MTTSLRYLLAALCSIFFWNAGFTQTNHNGHWCAASKPVFTASPDPRSDSIDILHTEIALDITDFAGKTIAGTAAITFKAKLAGVSQLRFDLLNMNITNIAWNAPGLLDWNYNGQVLQINFGQPFTPGADYPPIAISYQGQPAQDGSGWGGWYWQSPYAYNLGVGFDADPHNYGRVWYPCFDNFVERSTYRFDITTDAGRPAYCNGQLISDTPLANGKRQRSWAIEEPIPSYLTCVAVGPYASFTRTYTGEQGPVPVEIAVAPVDSNNLKNSFIHLPEALACYEHWYGPYRWNKIGYSVVPFNGGAMEHATNVAYPKFAVDGTTTWETLMAHEFSHHWWGDLATCRTAEDMWLNEGWAVFSEHLFTEWTYGRTAYVNAVSANFLDVLQNTHVEEGGYRAVSGLPHDLTYGSHVYNKGAVVAHNLRGYLGDSLFRQGLRTVLNETAFADWSSEDLRDKLSAATGSDLHDFFDDWVFQPGFTHFSVDSVKVTYSSIDAPTQMQVFVRQKLRGAAHFYQNVPVEFTFVYPDWSRETRTAMVSGEYSAPIFEFPAWQPAPSFVWVNTNGLLTFARAEKEKVIKNLGSSNFTPARMDLKINTLPAGDSALVRVEHHWVMPDTASIANAGGFYLTHRYWTIDGDFPAGFDAQASVFYDGQGSLDQLDTELFAQTSASEDSILVLYRQGPGMPWTEWPTYVKNTLGSANNRYGFLRIDHLQRGQYTIAKGVSTVSAKTPVQAYTNIRVSPNPAASSIRIKAEIPFDNIRIFSQKGDLTGEWNTLNVRDYELFIEHLPAGQYWIILSGKEGMGATGFQKI